jgi:class 3 adenylate cyclase
MGLREDIETEVRRIFKEQWDTRDGTVVPESEDLGLGNEAVKLEGTVLYADISGSTRMVDAHKDHFSAEVYKTYLYCAAKLIKEEDGAITAYDGDRIMAVFIGSSKNTSAVKCGLKLNYAVQKIINPALQAQYQNSQFILKHVVGVDTSPLYVARTGVRGANDLVWVGRAANYAAKLTELDIEYPTWITGTIYNNMHNSVKFTEGKQMWEERVWKVMNDMSIYRSNWRWSI